MKKSNIFIGAHAPNRHFERVPFVGKLIFEAPEKLCEAARATT
ncbi:MAG TPA: hypothetical protein VGX50_02120 [Longimicrobium sp.]|nr:hypothetical protein [Longimicrobium sp.]